MSLDKMLEKILINKNVRKETEKYIQSISEKEELEKAQSCLREKYCGSVEDKGGLIAGISTYLIFAGGGVALGLSTTEYFTSAFIWLPLTIGILPMSFSCIFASSIAKNIFSKYVYKLTKEKGQELGYEIKYDRPPGPSPGAGGLW